MQKKTQRIQINAKGVILLLWIDIKILNWKSIWIPLKNWISFHFDVIINQIEVIFVMSKAITRHELVHKLRVFTENSA